MAAEEKKDLKRVATVLFPAVGTRVGGSVVSTALLARAVAALPGWKVRIALPGRGANAELFAQAGVEPEFYGLSENTVEQIRSVAGMRRKVMAASGFWVAYRHALHFLKEKPPDIVHVNDDATMLIWGLAARQCGIPLLWHVRQSMGSFLSDRIRSHLADQLVFNSKATAKRLPSRRASPRQRIIHNVVDTRRYYPSADRREHKKRLGVSPERVLIGFVGNLMLRKRPEWMVQAGVDLLAEGCDAEIVIVGKDYSDGSYTEKLRKLAEAGGAEKRIHLLGYRSDVPDIMRALDIFALPSIAEPFGLVVIEAMASKAAVVATNDGGVPEIVENGCTGVLTSREEYKAFLQALRMMVCNEEKREEFAEAGYRSVLNRFSVERIGNEIGEVYEQLLKK
ncbi:MAG: glycosyltransferase family 4 protein [Opitutales bacterium]